MWLLSEVAALLFVCQEIENILSVEYCTNTCPFPSERMHNLDSKSSRHMGRRRIFPVNMLWLADSET